MTRKTGSVITDYEKMRTIGDSLFSIIMPCVMTGILLAGFYMKNVKPIKAPKSKVIAQVQTQFIMENKLPQKPKKPVPVKKEAPKPAEKKDEVIDLTKNPVLAQKQDDIQQTNTPPAKTVKRVFGLRKVYSMGLGAGGSMSDAVIGKLGNTINKEFDTVTATNEVIKGAIVSTTTITDPPKFLKKVKPEYTKEMLDNKVEGTIKVRVLVDIDGKVKKALVLNDLGFGTKEIVEKACFELEFEPAKRGNDPVAVWIIITFPFVLLG